ncbi:Helix-turn-helix domain-containing protein [Micromonospora carbonacea]|uniref:Helix-turn-helix domain-containing protein n=1 Tax=Micromonospora carbonacea TaxID=47853 RepID=A0A1C4Z1P8_9ACTN|nr:Helix-turn-helix domain-containing protein [Micromonospora carbonacea]
MHSCYNMHVTQGPERGVAYDFWWRVRTEQGARGWTDEELRARTGVARTTVDRLQAGRRPPTARVVNALAEALDIDLTEAHRLAGRTPAPPVACTDEDGGSRVSAREAVRRDPAFTDQQRRTLLDLLDIFEQANRGRRA